MFIGQQQHAMRYSFVYVLKLKNKSFKKKSSYFAYYVIYLSMYSILESSVERIVRSSQCGAQLGILQKSHIKVSFFSF